MKLFELSAQNSNGLHLCLGLQGRPAWGTEADQCLASRSLAEAGGNIKT